MIVNVLKDLQETYSNYKSVYTQSGLSVRIHDVQTKTGWSFIAHGFSTTSYWQPNFGHTWDPRYFLNSKQLWYNHNTITTNDIKTYRFLFKLFGFPPANVPTCGWLMIWLRHTKYIRLDSLLNQNIDVGRPWKTMEDLCSRSMTIYPIGSMYAIFQVTWIPSITPLYVSIYIYTSTMDPSWVWPWPSDSQPSSVTKHRSPSWNSSSERMIPVLNSNSDPSYAAWWLTYPFEKWDDEIPNIWKNKTCSKPPTSMSCHRNCTWKTHNWQGSMDRSCCPNWDSYLSAIIVTDNIWGFPATVAIACSIC